VIIPGIGPAAVTGAPSLEDSMHRLAGILSDNPIRAHNIGYDAGVLRRLFEIAVLPQPSNDFRCTEKLSRAALVSGSVATYFRH
jgi:DNA polymerase III epsilon subunit-like protein